MNKPLDDRTLNNLSLMLVDLMAGDEAVLARSDYKSLSKSNIDIALKFLLDNPSLDEQQKTFLFSNSWKINYRDKPPTPQNFISEKYLGPAAVHTYDRIKTVFEQFMDPSKPYRNLILYPHIGWGKELVNNSIVRTYEGKGVPIGDITVGTQVCAVDGTITTVTGVFPQGKKPIYRIVFADGRFVDAGEDHQWKAAKSRKGRMWDKNLQKYVYDKEQSLLPSWQITTTKQIYEDLQVHNKARWCIPLAKAAQHKENLHIIAPYTLGVLLGDGCLSEKALTFCGNDKTIFDEVAKDLPTGAELVYHNGSGSRAVQFVASLRQCRPQYESELQRLQLSCKGSHDKFIPDEYLYDSITNRVALLQGLMDTDGTVNKKAHTAHLQFYTTSERLRDNMLTLVRGLGGIARYAVDDRQQSHRAASNQRHVGYNVYFTFPTNDFAVFRLPRKQQLVETDFATRSKAKPQQLYIKSIEQISDAEATCIMVDHPEHLFLAEDYVVTHNSYLSMLTTLYIGTHLSMMRNPYKFFGLNPATVLAQLLVSYSLKKSSEVLLEPLLAILETSPFYEKVHTRESMAKKEADFARQSGIDRIYWTTASPTSQIQMSNGANIKTASSPSSLLGLSVVSGVLSELAFFRDAGKALALDELIVTDCGNRTMAEVQVGDKVLSPSGDYTEVVAIPWEGVDDLYEIEMEDGRTVRCNAKHLWPVTYRKNGQTLHEVVETQFMIDHPEIEFDIQEV